MRPFAVLTTSIVVYILVLSACHSEAEVGGMAEGSPPVVSMRALSCTVDREEASLRCQAPAGAPGTMILGGQGINVGLRSSNVTYDGGTDILSADVTVENFSSLPLATLDGTTQAGGVSVFFVSGPSGPLGETVDLPNADGEALFTASAQPYFFYNQLLPVQGITSAKSWQFKMNGTASFTFSVLVAANTPAAGAVARWSIEPGFTKSNWVGVTGWGADGVALFGNRGEVVYREDGAWSSTQDPAGLQAGTFSAGSANDLVTYLAADSRIRWWDGIGWRSIEAMSGGPGATTSVLGVVALGPRDLVAFGYALWRFDGTEWSVDTLPTGVTYLAAATAVGGDLLTFTNAGRVWRYRAGAWTQIGPAGGSGQTSNNHMIVAVSENELWTFARSSSFIRHWNGTSWSTPTHPGVPSPYYTLGAVAFSATDAWLATNSSIGEGRLWHWDGVAWTVARSSTNFYSGVWGPNADEVFLSGSVGLAEVRNGAGVWSSFSPAGISGSRGVRVVTDSLVYVSNEGKILKFDGTSWSIAASGTPTVSSLWASGPNDVWGVRSDARLWRFNGTTWSAGFPSMIGSAVAVGGSGPADIWAVGNTGGISRFNGSTWTERTESGVLTTGALNGVWAASPTFALAVGNAGTILRWNGTAWAAQTSGTANALRGVWGTSASDAWAVGDAGTILHWDGAAWSPVTSGTANALNGVWGGAADEVYAVGAARTVLIWNGTAWKPMAHHSSSSGTIFRAVSGVPGGRVFIAGDQLLRGTR
jgi:hypothetical protein